MTLEFQASHGGRGSESVGEIISAGTKQSTDPANTSLIANNIPHHLRLTDNSIDAMPALVSLRL